MMREIQWCWVVSLLIGSILLSACAGGSSSQAGETPFPGEDVMVTFKVEIPSNSPPGEVVSILFLDEVTGLGLKPKRYDMHMTDLTHYMITVPVQPGGVLKYRYARQGATQALEHYSDGSPVRYRLFRVDGPGVVADLVSLWSDTSYNVLVGNLIGFVRDEETGQGIPGMLVMCAGAQVKTGWDGRFVMGGLPAGLHNLVVYAPDGYYRTFQQGALVGANTTTQASFTLRRSGHVSVVFRVAVPEETAERAVVRIAGNLTQLGNTFGDLPGGASVQASLAPAMIRVDPSHYALALNLPVGADVGYKYTLGDGFWNAERGADGDFLVRRLIVPEKSTLIEDQVTTWRDSDMPPMVFQYIAKQAGKTSVQFYLHSWTQEIPAWQLEDERHWTYTLYSPLNLLDSEFKTRFCPEGHCEN